MMPSPRQKKEPDMSTNLLVKRDDWSDCRFVESDLPDLGEGQVLLEVDRFALTSNNITYAVAGDMLDYWGFFPAEDGWGRIPVMGFGEVTASRHADVAEGGRVFGFFPMATDLVIDASQVSRAGFSDGVAHRAKHAPVYRQYSLVDADGLYEAKREDQILLLRGLFMTSFLVDDYIADNDDFGAGTFVISSASSKTGLALAHQLSRRSAGRVVGLTSPRNTAFVESLGCYDEVRVYGDAKSLDPGAATVFVDHAGDVELVDTLHHHLGENMKSSIIVGATHWNAGGQRSTDLPGATPEMFFAPGQIQKRSKEWGPAELQRRLGEGWRDFVASTDAWLNVIRGAGKAQVEQTYRLMLEGRAQPADGHILSLKESAAV
jgi:NADPH-dependent curcumin reductase CurA